jgi:hypothetical protein
MKPALVTLRLPDARGGSVAVSIPLWCPAYSKQKAAGHVASDLIGLCLEDAKPLGRSVILLRCRSRHDCYAHGLIGSGRRGLPTP